MITFIAVWHYAPEDKDFSGDYWGIDLLNQDREPVISWGDAYHERGQDKMLGFLAGVEYIAEQQVKVVTERINDEY